ncbi:hypothetical protein POM88_013027 [Heracleum sosnowskyi]|uniref:Ubiquitin-like protease family profile domain-containing protein n=1 Tax=Heracleum sosnowskyi TaxID=360622 RepID=A0AAD8J061_9APIA|nr:hypothetical protein POM88_013027 [Heracleum sosnowskyi]
MRTTRSSSLRNRKADSGQKEKLNDQQAIYYMRRLWSFLPESIKGCCVYIDPAWMLKFRTQFKEREGVIEWLGRLNIFMKKYVFFPLCLSNHWTLVILCNPGGDIKRKKERPSMILLDSLDGSMKSEVEIFMSSVLHDLYKNRCISQNDFGNIKLAIPKVPKQIDDKTCGFFVLYYMTLFLKEIQVKFDFETGYPAFLNRDWFTQQEFDCFHRRLSDIFNRIDDYTKPISMSVSSGGFNNDLDTIDVIRTCLRETGDIKSESCLPKFRKRKMRDVEEFFFCDRALPTKLFGRYETPKYINWKVFSLRKIELFIIKSETLAEGGLKAITADTEDFNSWKDEDITGKQNPSDEHPELLKNTVEQLEESLSTYEKWSDKFVDLIQDLSTEFKEEERVVALKEKFVDMNNAANWVAETVFKNSIGSMYVERLNAATLERRQKRTKQSEMTPK